MRKVIKQAAQAVADPLKHISLKVGDGVALAWLGFFTGIVVDRLFAAGLVCFVPS